jgi:hypothetical protein
MKCPPYLVHMRIADEQRTKFRLWLPLFILWPLLLVILILVVVATLIADLISMATLQKPKFTRFVFGILGVLSETRGTEINIQDKRNQGRTVAFTVR